MKTIFDNVLHTKKRKLIGIIIFELVILVLMIVFIFSSLKINAIEFNNIISKCNNYVTTKYEYDSLTKQRVLDETNTKCSKIEGDTDKRIKELEAKADTLKLDYSNLDKQNKIKYEKSLKTLIKKEEDQIAKQKTKNKTTDSKNTEEDKKADNIITIDSIAGTSNSSSGSNSVDSSDSVSGGSDNSGSSKPETQTCPPQIVPTPGNAIETWYDAEGCLLGWGLEDGTALDLNGNKYKWK